MNNIALYFLFSLFLFFPFIVNGKGYVSDLEEGVVKETFSFPKSNPEGLFLLPYFNFSKSENNNLFITDDNLIYSEDFEGNHGFTLVNAYYNKWHVGGAISNGVGTKSLYISNDNGISNQYLVDGYQTSHAYRDLVIPTNTSEISISFDWRSMGDKSFDRLRVWLVPTSFEPVGGKNIKKGGGRLQIGRKDYSDNNVFLRENIVVDVSEYAGENRRLIFEWYNDKLGGIQPPAAIDNLIVSKLTCPTISNFIFEEITQNSMEVSWTAPLDESEKQYELFFSTSNQAPADTATPTHNATARTNFTFDNLTPNTVYYIWIRTNCSANGTNFWMGPFKQRSAQIPLTLPYKEDFEGDIDFALENGMNGWKLGSAIHNGPGTKALYISNDNGVSNQYDVNITSISHAYRDFAIPENVPEISISFDWKSMGEINVDRLRVWLVPTTFWPLEGQMISANGAERVQLGRTNYSGSNEFIRENLTVDVSTFAGQNRRLVFEWRNNRESGEQSPVAIDNLNIELIKCHKPTNFTIDDVSQNSIAVSWSAPLHGAGNAYDIFLGTTNEVPNATTNPTHLSTTTNFVFDNLTLNTGYYIWIRTNCNVEGTSFWFGPLEAITSQIPKTLPYLEDFEGEVDFFLNNGINPWVFGSAVHNGQGTKSLYISKDNGVSNEYDVNSAAVSHAYRDLALPENTQEIDISFDWRCEGETAFDRLRVWLVPISFIPVAGTQITSAADRLQVGRANYSANEEFLRENLIVDISAFAGQNRRLIFEWSNDNGRGNQPPAAVDNLSVSVVACSPPPNFLIGEVTQSSIATSWGQTNNNRGGRYDIYFHNTDQVPDQTSEPTYSSETTRFTFENLIPNTVYFIWIRKKCDTDVTSSWSGPFKVRTSQIPQTLPYFEDFEGNTNFAFNNGENAWALGNAIHNREGRKSLYISNDNGASNLYNIREVSVSHAFRDLIIPSDIQEISVSFDWRSMGELTLDGLKVWMVPTSFTPEAGERITANGTERVQIGRANYSLNDEFLLENIIADVSAFAGQNRRLVFEWHNNPSGGNQPPAAIDNLEIKNNSCSVVINFQTEIMDDNGDVLLTWEPSLEEKKWEVFIVPLGETGPTTTTDGIIVDKPQYVFKNGNHDLFYKAYVRPICSENSKGIWTKEEIISYIKPPGCAQIFVDVSADGNKLSANSSGDYIICQDETMHLNLDASFFDIPSTAKYDVMSIDYRPPFPFVGGIEMPITSDDMYTSSFNLPFTFSFFGESYDFCKIGDNGVITFGLPYTDIAGGYCEFRFGTEGEIPSQSFPIKNSIYGIYQDMLTNNNPGPNTAINYQVIGKYPCRTLVVNFSEVPAYKCNLEIYRTTTQIVLYEITNIIEVYVKKRRACMLWKGGVGVLGIQNEKGTLAYAPPGRNTGNWEATEEAWRFSPSGSSSVKFSWEKEGVFFSNETSIDITIDEPILYTARAIYDTYEGGTVEVVKQLNFVKEKFSIQNPIDLYDCTKFPDELNSFNLRDNDEIVLEGLDPTKYKVDYFLNETDVANGTNPLPDVYKTADPSVIYVRVQSIATSCYKSKMFNLNVFPHEITKFEKQSFCGSFEFPVLKEGAAYYTKAYGKGDRYEGGDVFSSIGEHTFYIYVEKEDGCTYQTQFLLEIVEAPVLDVIEDMLLSCETFILPELSDYNKYYTEKGGNGIELKAGKEIIFPSTIYIQARKEGRHGAVCVEESSFRIEFEDCAIPKGISPNGDGLNDFFDLTGYGISEIKIYNRYGVEVFAHGLGYYKQWFGQDKAGNLLPDGTYYYELISYGRVRKGWVQINK